MSPCPATADSTPTSKPFITREDLERGGGQVRCELALILLQQRVISEKDADVLTGMIEQLERRAEEWERTHTVSQISSQPLQQQVSHPITSDLDLHLSHSADPS